MGDYVRGAAQMARVEFGGETSDVAVVVVYCLLLVLCVYLCYYMLFGLVILLLESRPLCRNRCGGGALGLQLLLLHPQLHVEPRLYRAHLPRREERGVYRFELPSVYDFA